MLIVLIIFVLELEVGHRTVDLVQIFREKNSKEFTRRINYESNIIRFLQQITRVPEFFEMLFGILVSYNFVLLSLYFRIH